MANEKRRKCYELYLQDVHPKTIAKHLNLTERTVLKYIWIEMPPSNKVKQINRSA